MSDSEGGWSDDDEEMIEQPETLTNNIVKQTERYNIMNDNNITNELESKVTEINEYFDINSLDKSLKLLLYFLWDQNKLQNSIENFEEVRVKAGVDVAPDLKPFEMENCPICFEDMDESNKLAEECGHSLCKNCWIDYLTNKITTEPLEAMKARCPGHPQCNLVVSKSMWQNVLSPDHFALWQKWLKMHYVNNQKSIKYCPNECNYICKILETPHITVVCECKHLWCFSCLSEDHTPLDCTHFQNWSQRVQKDNEDMVYIYKNTKECPNKNCKERIEKNQGCSRMMCLKCKYEFCWSCMQKWHGYDNISKCIYYDNAKSHNDNLFIKDDMMDKYQKDQYPDDQNKYMFCINKYADNRTSIEFIRKTSVPKLKEIIANWQEHNLAVYLETNYIYEAYKAVMRLRTVLKYCYAQYFYQRDKLELFENYLIQINTNVEKLSEETDNFEKNLNKYGESEQDYNEYKFKVINMTSKCNEIWKKFKSNYDQ